MDTPTPAQPANGDFVHDDRFLEAFLNRPHRVLGRNLRPFSLWHNLLLESIQSPFLTGRGVTAVQLWQAVRVCSSRWTGEGYRPNLNPPTRLRWLWEVGRYGLRRECEAFADYLRDFDSSPKFMQSEENKVSNERDIDDNLELACHLESQGYTPADVWNMPLGMAKWRSAVAVKCKGGDIHILTPLHEAHMEKLKQLREASIATRAQEIAATTGVSPEQAYQQARDEYQQKVRAGLAFIKNQHGRPKPQTTNRPH